MKAEDVAIVAGVVGMAGVLGYIAYDVLKPPEGQKCLSDQCVGGVLYRCINGTLYKTSTYCDESGWLLCPICLDKYACEQKFPGLASLDVHLAVCHPSTNPYAPSFFTEHPVFKGPDHVKGAEYVEYKFCKPVVLNFMSGMGYLDCRDNPAGYICLCNCDLTIEVVKVNGELVSLWAVRVGCQRGEGVPAPLSLSPNIEVSAVRFRGHADGATCYSWDPRIEKLDVEFGIYSITESSPLVCQGKPVGWGVLAW